MYRPARWTGALVALVTAVPLLALLYVGSQLAGLPFAPFDLFDWLARILPGDLVTAGIDAMVAVIAGLNLGATDVVAKTIEQSMAIGLFLLLAALAGLAAAELLRRSALSGWQAGALCGVLFGGLVAAITATLGRMGNLPQTLLWLGLTFAGWGALQGYLLTRTAAARTRAPVAQPADQGPKTSRRAVLLRITGGALATAAGLTWLGRRAGPGQQAPGAGNLLTSLDDTPPGGWPPPQPAATIAPPMRAQMPPAPGTRREVTPNPAFYRIDINTVPPMIDGSEWQLETAGLFAQPRSLTLADLLDFPAVTQPITLSCISNRIGGDLIGTSYWTGVRLRDLLEELGMQQATQELFVEAEDGFFESVAMADMLNPNTLLVYGMNGKTLPVEHGYPLRIYIPNRYGMKQPKWITRITAIDHAGAGYWVERGWSATARPNIISIIDNVATDSVQDGRIPVGGIAWAGNRGIRQVEVQVDDGAWQAADLLTPPLSELTWVLWRYDWPRQAGRHTFRVRATDGSGTLQTAERSDPHPSGATGYHTVTATV